MPLLETIAIAVGLSMDALAVAIASGVAIRELRIRHALRIALFFGGFQALMPLIGWLAGLGLRTLIAGIDHWVAFALLTLIGCKMIIEAVRRKPEDRPADPLNLYVLLILAIATSIDALAVGITFSFLRAHIIAPVIVIGAVTFLISLAGVYLGRRFGHLLENKMEVAGGLILIAIGAKILIEHLASA